MQFRPVIFAAILLPLAQALPAAGDSERPAAEPSVSGFTVNSPNPNPPPRIPENFRGLILADSSVLLSWKPNTETDLKLYLLFRDTTPTVLLDSAHRAAEILKPESTYLDIKLVRPLFYTLLAVDLTNLKSFPSAVVALAPTAVGETPKGNRPREFELAQNYPNPFNANTTISFSVSTLQLRSESSTDKKGSGELAIYNIVGQKIRTLASGEFKAGTYSFTWDGRDQNGAVCPTAVYFYSLQIGEFRQTKKMVLVK